MIKRIRIAVMSIIALAFSAPVGFRTANTKRGGGKRGRKLEDVETGAPAAPAVEVPTPAAEPPDPREQPIDQSSLSDETKTLIKGAGVDAKDVVWRIRAGLTPYQAVEVAAAEKAEADAAKK